MMKDYNSLARDKTPLQKQRIYNEGVSHWLMCKNKMMLCMALLLLSVIPAMGQTVASYGFEQTNGTYTPITGGTQYLSTSASSLDENTYSNLPIGFTFKYKGIDYTSFGINANGWINMGSTAPVSSFTPISGTTNEVISAFANDLIARQHFVVNRTASSAVLTVTAGNINNLAIGSVLAGTGIPTGATVVSKTASTITMSANSTSAGSGSHLRVFTTETGIRYQTTGTAPNRSLIVQFTEFSTYIANGSSGDKLNFQIILNESINTINIVYNVAAPLTAPAFTSVQVGLRGASGDFNNRSGTTSWSSTIAGTTNLATVAYTTTSYPVSGLTFSWTPSTSPVISATTLTSFGNVCVNTVPASNSFTVSGSNLTGNVTVGALAGFTYSTTSAGTYTSTLTLTPASGSLSQAVFVKFSPVAAQSYSGNIPVTGGGATAINVAATGTGVSTPPTLTTNGTAGSITLTSANITGSVISNMGCTAVTIYGIQYSTSATFANNNATSEGSNFSGTNGGTFTTPLSGLTPGTQYFYRPYATNGGGIAYGSTSGTFTTLAPGQIGNGIATSNNFPITSNYGSSYSQQIYTAAELTATQSAGNTYITKIRFKQISLGTQSTYNNWTIFIGNTAKTAFASTTDWVPTTALAQVFSGTIPTLVANTWVEITLTTPFIWDGTSNLVIGVDENATGFSSSTWASYTAGTARGISYFSDSVNPNPASPPAANLSLSADIAQIQIVAIPVPNCGQPTALSATATSDTTGTGSFAAPTIGDSPTAYFYELRASGAAGSGATGLTESGTLAGTGTFTFTSALTGNTTYTLYVRSTCGAESGVFSAGVSFTTACSPVQAFTQNFDASTSIPACWAKVGTPGTANITTAGSASSPNSLSMLGSSTSGKVVVSLPPVSNAGANTHWLRFKYRYQSTSETIEVGYLTTPSNPASFVAITSVAASSALFTEAQLDLGTAAGSNKYLAFRAGTTNSTVYIDDVIWETKPSCFVPTAPLAATPSVTSAVLTFGASPTNPANYEYYVSTSSTSPTAATTPSGSTATTTATAIGLNPNTIYYWWVRAACGVNDNSLWVGGSSFTTAKLEPTNFATNFAVTAASVTTTTIPLTWTAATGAVVPDGYNVRANTGTITAPADGTDPVTGSLSLATLPASYKTTGASSSFTGGTPGTMYNFANYTYTNSGANINFKTDGTAPMLNYATKPAVVTALASNLPNTTSAQLSWTLPASFNAANHTVLVFVKAGSTIATGTLTNGPDTYTASAAVGTGTAYQLDANARAVYKGTGTGVTITGLAMNQTYYVTVVVVMNTANYNTTYTYSANVDTSVLVGYCMPNSTGGKYITNVTITGGATGINNSSTQGTNSYEDFTSSVTAASAIQGATVNFSVATINTSFLSIWVDWDNNFVFSDSERVYNATVTTTGPNTGTFMVPVNALTGNHRMRLRNSATISPSACGTINNGEAEDYTFNVLQAPVPVITSFTPESYCAASGVLTINGIGLLNAAVTIGGTAITPLTTNTATQITATVSAGVSGTIVITTPGGTVTSTTPFAVTAPPVVTLSSSTATICAGASTAVITITQGASSYTNFVWTSVPANQPVSGTAASGFTFSPSVNAIYTLSASNPGTTCATTATFTVTVNALPGAINVTPAAVTICDGNIQAITATGGIVNKSGVLGTQTSTSGVTGITPFSSNYEGSREQYIVKASELTALGFVAGNIKSLGFNVTASGSGSYAQRNFSIKIGKTSDEDLLLGYGIVVGNFTTVYSALQEPAPAAGLKTYTFTTPFGWDGVSNILVDICHDNDVADTCLDCYSSNSAVAVSTTTFDSVYGTYGDDEQSCGVEATSEISTYTSRPVMTFAIENALLPIWTSNNPTNTLYTDAAATVPYTGTATATVYAKPSVTTSYTATITNTAGCTAGATSIVTVGPKQWIGGTSTDYNNPANWCGNQVPDANDNVTIAQMANQPVISGGMTVVGNTLTVQAGAVLTVQSGNVVNITNAVTVAPTANIILQNNAHLLQGTAATTNTNSGNIESHRNSSELYRLDYTLWSSPVAGQVLQAFSPLTTASRFYTYNTDGDFYTNNVDSSLNPGTDVFAPAQGYLIRTPNTGSAAYNAGTETIVYDGKFTGVPNNGNIDKALNMGGTRYNLIGNPYPSPISIDDFFAGNQQNLTGTIYIWRKRNAATVTSAYVTINSVGDYNGNQQEGANDPDDILQTGQGFIVQALENATDTSVHFTNTMRSGDVTHDSSFFRNGQGAEKHRLWLNLNNTEGFVSQALVGYRENATMGVDNGIDSEFINDAKISLNSVIGDKVYSIQGRALPFADTDVVPMQFKTNVAGTYTITVDHVDGLFEGSQEIYIKDNITGDLQSIKENGYSFATESGLFNNRFEVHYRNTPLLGTDAPVADANSVIIYKEGKAIHINSGKAVMANVKIFDIRGRLVHEANDVNASDTTITNLQAEQVLIVQVTTTTNVKVSKKVIY